MLSVEEYEKRRELREETGGEYSYNIASLLDASSTVQYQEKQTTSDKALNLGKSIYNGFMSVPRGVLRGVQWLRDVNEAQLNEAYPERMQMDEGARQLLDDAADAEFLQPYEVRADSSAERFAYDLAQGAGQLGGQLAVGLATGGYGTLPAMALQIGGEEYKELRDQGIDVETAGKAAAFNAAVQTPLEFIGFSKLTKAFPANSMLKQRLRHVAEDALTEGITEYLQEYPEQLSKIWAENADKSPEEIAQIIWDKLGNIHSSATYSGLIGATLGTGAGGMRLALDHKLDRSIERAMQREVYTEMTEHVDSTVNRIKETGINPQYAGAVINDNLQNQTVYVDGESLAGYAQEKGAEKVAESLGVSVEDIKKAAASGDTVDVKLGNFEATCAAFDGFFQEVKDGTAFEDGGYTPKKEQAEQEQIKRDRERFAELRDKFKAEEDRIISEFTEAGVGKQLAMGQVELLRRFAENLNPDYALAIMQSYKVRRGENGEVQAGYGQFAGENAKTADKIKLTEAQTMESEGKSADEIYKATGWFKGLDNKWRFEIKDNFEGIDFTPLLGDDDHQVTLKEIYKNPKLYKAYPFLRNLKVYPNDFGGDNGKRGRTGTLQDDSPYIELNENLMRNEPERIKETLTHEIQHIIQAVERFAAGGARTTARKLIAEEIQRIAQSEDTGDVEALSSELDSSSSDYDLYRRLGGEQEARETARRAKIQNEIATVEKHIKEARRKGDKAALKRAQFAKALLERQNGGTPSPHQSDAIIVFDGKEIPYSLKQDEIFADAEEQNTMQAKSRSKESGFFDAMKSLFQAAWHGSPHTFEKFDLGAIGTGEGAQVHGWGLYFAQDRNVAKGYKERLSLSKIIITPSGEYQYRNGRVFNRNSDSGLPDPATEYALSTYATFTKRGNPPSKEKVIKELNDQLKLQQSRSGLRLAQEKAEYLKDAIELTERDYDQWKMESGEGSLFQVEIPDNDVLLDEQKTFEEQPEKVQEVIRRIVKDIKDKGLDEVDSRLEDFVAYYDVYTGRQIYKMLVHLENDINQEENPQRAASELLNQYGVEGITYEGGRDGRCFVVFDDQAVNIIDTYNQKVNGQGENKGKYNPYDNVVTMFKGADASTVIHETWHFFVEQMWNMVESGNASEQTVKDFETLLSYAGMTMDEWKNADLDGRRKAHEKLAEAGETYIMEGKSPSYELRRVFRNFAKWLKAIYATIQRSENYAELTDDVREVFDRMLAAEDDIAHMERVNGYFSKLPDVITDNMSDETRAKVEDYIEKAREKAVDILTRRSLVNYTKERRKEIKKFKDEIRPMVEDEVSKRPVYACGYDKKDAARFRELRTQQESVGIWTDENFIDRAFPADTKPLENEVAHLAAVVNPKNWTKGLGEVKKDYQRQADEILQPALNALESGAGQGVDIVQNQDGTTGRDSNNARWYQEFYAANKRKPTKTERREMARQLVSGDVNAPQVEGWMPTTAEEAEAMQAEGERLADIERHIAACEEIKEKLAEVKKNYSETSAAGSEEFLFRAELTAEQYGYSSADEMMQDIEKSPTKAEGVKQRINERVQELTMQDERNNYEAMIRESLYNEDEALLIGVEQQLIEEYAAKAKERQEANEQKAEERAEQRKVNAEVAAARKQQAKNAARADLAKMNIKEATRTSKFITAERNAAMKSAKLLAQKKFDEALTQKNLQAYWHAMAAESMKIARRQKQYEKFLKKQVSLKREAWLNEMHFSAISQLFTRMGRIAKPIHKEAAAQSQFENLGAYAAAMEEQFDCVDIAPWILEGSTPISDTNALTLEQYEDVVNAVKNIKAIVKAQKGADMFASKEAWKETKAGIMERLSKLKTLWKPDPNKVSEPSKIEEWLAGLETMDTFCEMLDGGRYGWFSQHWNNLMKRCQDREYDMREAYDKAEADALKKWLPDKAAENAANEKIFYEELGESVTKHTLVRMLINLGNKENSQRICETVPVGFENSTLWVMPDESLAVNQKELKAMREEAREQTRQNLINFLGKVLTKEDVEYAQRKINAAGMNWEERVELDRRTKGFAPKKVEATPVVLNIGGEQVVLQGGYFPLMRYGETGSHPASAEVQPDEELQGRRIRTYHTNTSASRARTNARYAVDLRLGTERSSIYESIHDLCWREAMNDFRRVLNDQDVYAMLKSKVGISRMNLFKELLEVSADGQNSKALSAFEQSMVNATGWLTSKTANSLIMCSLKVTTQNGADTFLYGNAVEGYTMADNISALGRYMLKWFNPSTQKEMQDFVFSKSAYMKERSLIPDVTIRDIISENKERKWEKVVRETTTKMFAYTDNATAIPNWIQAYNKKLNEGATEQEAIDFADTVVRRVKGSSRNTEVSSMQRSKAYKPITMFQSFFNARLNEFLRMERYAANQWTDGQKAEAFSTVASYVMGKFLMQAMLSLAFALENPFGIDDEDGWPKLIKELKSQTFSMFGPFGQAASGFIGAAAGMHEFDYRMSAIESTVNKGISAVRAVKSDKKSTAEKVEVVTNFASLVSGAPMQITKVFWNLFDIAYNNMPPEIGDIMRRRPKKERK